MDKLKVNYNQKMMNQKDLIMIKDYHLFNQILNKKNMKIKINN